MDGEDEHPMLVLQLAQAQVANRALAALAAPDAALHERHGAIGEAQYHLRWLRPSLLFPPDAPDAVRVGLSVEGGVVLPTGRILSVDAFLTATAIPDLVQTAEGFVAQIALRDLTDGQVQLNYGDQPLPPAPVRPAQGLPTDDELDVLYSGLNATLVDWLGALPPLPLTPPLPTERPAATRIAAEGAGAAFALCFPEEAADAPLPLMLDTSYDAAILLNGPAVGAAFAEVATAQQAGWLKAPWHVESAMLTTGAEVLRIGLTARLDGATGAPVAATISAIPLLAGDKVRLRIGDVELADAPMAGAAGERLVAALAAPGFVSAVEAALTAAIKQATDSVFGPSTEAFRWQWGTQAFTGMRLDLGEGWLALVGPAPTAPSDEALPELLAVDVHISPRVEPLDGGRVLRVTTVAAPLTPVTLPADYAWWNAALPHTLLLEHSPSLPVELRVAEDDPQDTVPRHLRTQSAPSGIVTLHVALIDAFGRVALAEQAVDPRDLPAEPPTVVLDAPTVTSLTSAGTFITPASARTVITPTPTLSEIPTRSATAYAPSVRQAQTRSSLLGILAGALAVFALFTLIAAVILTRTPGVQGQTLPPTATRAVAVQPTATPGRTPTPRPGKTPTPKPTLFGIFAPTPAALAFACSGGHTAPQTLTLTNSGTAGITWGVTVYGAVTTSTSTQPWAVVAPTSGTLAAGGSVALTVTPANAFCGAPSSVDYLLQFTATSGSAVPVNVRATHS